MSKLIQALKSRTTWTIVAIFIVNGVSAVRSFIPPAWLPVADATLGLLAVYFHINPSQNYK